MQSSMLTILCVHVLVVVIYFTYEKLLEITYILLIVLDGYLDILYCILSTQSQGLCVSWR